LWQRRGGRAEFALAGPDGSFPILHESRPIKSPNSGSRTPPNSQKTNNGNPLKSPKISILQNQKSHRNRSIHHESQRISNRLAQSAFREGFGPHKRISNRLAQSVVREGSGLRQHISNRLAQSVVREGFGLRHHISNRLAQSVVREGFGLRQHISNRF
jgi:hypothetical protein